jgi:BirA family biotin operon repressor/biotin-[acetyl-CoA-carboxylase] ligase
LQPIDWKKVQAEGFIDTVQYYESVDSTNTLARTIAEQSPMDQSILVLAEEQTSGRGRGENVWWTGTGSLAFSLIVSLETWSIAESSLPMVSLATGLAGCETLATTLGNNPTLGIHWPNDLFVNKKKISGILSERLVDGRIVIGMGININNSIQDAPEELQTIITSLIDLTQNSTNRTNWLIEFLEQFNSAMTILGRNPSEIANGVNNRWLQRGKTLTLDLGKETVIGVCKEIAQDGALVVETETGLREIYQAVVRKQH